MTATLKPSNLSEVGRRALMHLSGQITKLKERPNTWLRLKDDFKEWGWTCRGEIYGDHKSATSETTVEYEPKQEDYDSRGVLNELLKGKNLFEILNKAPKLTKNPKIVSRVKQTEEKPNDEKSFNYARDVAGIQSEEEGSVNLEHAINGLIKLEGKTFHYAARGVIFEEEGKTEPHEVDVKIFATRQPFETKTTPIGRIVLVNMHSKNSFRTLIRAHNHPTHDFADVEKVVNFLFSKKFCKE